MEKTVSYIESLKGAELQRKQKRCRTEKKCLKSLKKKSDLWAKEKKKLRFRASSQGHGKKHWQARIIQSTPLKGSNSND